MKTLSLAYVVWMAEVDGAKHLENDFTSGALVEAGRMSLKFIKNSVINILKH